MVATREAARTLLTTRRGETDGGFAAIRRLALEQMDEARQRAPSLLAEIRAEARQCIRNARSRVEAELDATLERARTVTQREDERVEGLLADVTLAARHSVAEASERAEALMREIAGQGPEKTLRRGFAIVRDEGRRPVSSAAAASSRDSVLIQFNDGTVPARIRNSGVEQA